MFKHLLFTIFIFFGCMPIHAAEKLLITVNQFVSHPALDAAEHGFEQALKDRGLWRNIKLIIDNSQGNVTNAVQIAKHHASLDPKFMVAIATPSAQANAKAKQSNTILAFVAVTDPKIAGLDKDPTTLGVTDQPPVAELLNVLTKILPQVKTIGVIFNPGEINSVQTLEQLESLAAKKNIRIEKVAVTSSTNVKLAAQTLSTQVDLIYVTQDNLVVSAIDTVVSVCKNAKIPVVAHDSALLNKGLLLTVGADYFDTGKQLGHMVADKIQGKVVAPGIQSPQVNKLKINFQTAQTLGITIPALFETAVEKV